MIRTNLYHKRIFWKQRFDKALIYLVHNDTPLYVSQHIINTKNEWCDHDKIDIGRLINIVYRCRNRTQKHYLFEVETEYNTETKYEKITKAVIRTEYDDNKDIVIVLRDNRIITAWLNNKTDRHQTLDYKKYVRRIDK